MERNKILNRYFKSAFIFDVLGIIPLYCNLNPNYTNILNPYNYITECLVFCKIVTFVSTYKRLVKIAEEKELLMAYIRLIKLFSFLLLIAHLAGILFFFIARREK